MLFRSDVAYVLDYLQIPNLIKCFMCSSVEKSYEFHSSDVLSKINSLRHERITDDWDEAEYNNKNFSYHEEIKKIDSEIPKKCALAWNYLCEKNLFDDKIKDFNQYFLNDERA